MSWPSPAAIKQDWEQREREERERISERERRHGMLLDVENAKRAREQARRRVEQVEQK